MLEDEDDNDAEDNGEVANFDAIDASIDISRSLLTTFVITSSGEGRHAAIAFLSWSDAAAMELFVIALATMASDTCCKRLNFLLDAEEDEGSIV